MPTKFSVVVPFHNEEENVAELYGRLHTIMEETGEAYELIFVDDGSTDRTYPLLRDIVAIDPQVVTVRLRRNFGQTSALAAGFAQAKGEYVIAMDGDLQHDPADIPAFVRKLAEGYDIVHHTSEVLLEFRLYREFFRALGNQTRLAIVELLRTKPHYVNEMGEKLGIEQSRISHNLACLLNCGFVEWEWNGKNKVYRLNPDLNPILTGIEKHLVKYAPALDSCGTLASESKPVVFVARSSKQGQSQRHHRRLRVKA